MGTIQYTKTAFKEPPRLSSNDYYILKNNLQNNPDGDIFGKTETFSEHFSNILLILVVSLIVAIFSFSLFKDGSIMIAVGGLSMMAFFFSIVQLFLEGPSFANFVKQREEYVNRLKYAIKTSADYQEFLAIF